MTTKQQLQGNRYELLKSIQEAKQKRHIINILCVAHFQMYGNIFGFFHSPSYSDLEEIFDRHLHHTYNNKQVEESEKEIFTLIRSYTNKKRDIAYLVKCRTEILKKIAVENKKR